jgi:ABC-type nickel/cobalt efflux system permease component RcnA
MKYLRRTSCILSLTLLCVGYAAAHPLGNFTINHFSRLNIRSNSISVKYVIDMAEIPTFQELQKFEGPAASQALDSYLLRVTRDFPENLVLTVDGARVPLNVVSRSLALNDGAGGMKTMRLECVLEGFTNSSSAPHRLEFQDNNFADRIGWREIVSSPQGVAVFDSTAFADSISNELRNYPNDLLAAPLDERQAQLSFTSGAVPANARPLQNRSGHTVAPKRDRLAELISVPRLTLQMALFGLLFAAFLGAVHAMSPGHGKAVVAAYLVGSRGTARHAAFLGLTVTMTHTAGVFALGLATLVASEYVVPERLYPTISLVSGLAVIAVGFKVLMGRLQALFNNLAEQPRGYELEHEHNGVKHEHVHGGSHSHLPPGADGSVVTWKALLALGISGGILPCPSALVVLLAAISLHRVGYGLVLVFAFSVGLAATLTTVGLVFVYAGRWLSASGKFKRVARVVPVASALVIVTAGTVICYAALDQSGYSISELISQLSARL